MSYWLLRNVSQVLPSTAFLMIEVTSLLLVTTTLALPPPSGIAAAACGGTVSGIARTALMSPNYPKNYGNNVSCSWTIQAPIFTNISLQLLFFLTEENGDFLDVYSDSQLMYS